MLLTAASPSDSLFSLHSPSPLFWQIALLLLDRLRKVRTLEQLLSKYSKRNLSLQVPPLYPLHCTTYYIVHYLTLSHCCYSTRISPFPWSPAPDSWPCASTKPPCASCRMTLSRCNARTSRLGSWHCRCYSTRR